jgi:hypothetical protein
MPKKFRPAGDCRHLKARTLKVKNTKEKLCRTIAAKHAKYVLDFVFNKFPENGTLVLKCVGVGIYMKCVLLYFN